MRVGDVMSKPAVTVPREMTVHDAIGITDIARRLPEELQEAMDQPDRSDDWNQ